MTNNDIMFRCEFDILKDTKSGEHMVMNFIQDHYLTNGQEFNNNFSFDNWKLVACWLYKFHGDCTAVPVFGRHSIRFWDNLPFFIFIKAPKLFFFLRPIIGFWMIMSVLNIEEKNANGAEYIDTDGDIIAYFVTEVFDFKWTRKIIDWMIRDSEMLVSWENIFSIYFPDDHFVLNAFKERL